jgi:hypothetical protein
MLQPTGIPGRAWVRDEWTLKDNYPTWVVEAAAPCLIVGELNKGKIPPNGCLPDSVRAIMATDRGMRQLLREELAKAKGIPNHWLQEGKWTGRNVEQLTDVHIWTAVSASLHGSKQRWNAPPTNLPHNRN